MTLCLIPVNQMRLEAPYQGLLRAFMETYPVGTRLRLIMWENGTIFCEPANTPLDQFTTQAQQALAQRRFGSVTIRYGVDAAVVSHSRNLSVVIPCVTEKINGVEDMNIIRYSRALLGQDRRGKNVVFDGFAIMVPL